ncbi:copper chaperone PCu(A)C [Neisseriaceae bacterium B1]
MKKIALALTATLLCQASFAKGFEIKDAYARATVGQPQSGAFMTITNTNKTDDVLISASVEKTLAETTELHTHINENGVMKMREVKDGIAIKAGQTQELKPGSYHIMFFGLKKDLTAGETFPVTLTFKSGAKETAQVTVRNMKPAKPMQHNIPHNMPQTEQHQHHSH